VEEEEEKECRRICGEFVWRRVRCGIFAM